MQKKGKFLSKMLLGEGSAAMDFEIKETKRQSRAVKVTHPPADRRQLHKRMSVISEEIKKRPGKKSHRRHL